MKKIKVFATFAIEDAIEEFNNLLKQMQEQNIIIKVENGKNTVIESATIGYSFEGNEKAIREILTKEWFPDYSIDCEWDEVEKLNV